MASVAFTSRELDSRATDSRCFIWSGSIASKLVTRSSSAWYFQIAYLTHISVGSFDRKSIAVSWITESGAENGALSPARRTSLVFLEVLFKTTSWTADYNEFICCLCKTIELKSPWNENSRYSVSSPVNTNLNIGVWVFMLFCFSTWWHHKVRHKASGIHERRAIPVHRCARQVDLCYGQWLIRLRKWIWGWRLSCLESDSGEQLSILFPLGMNYTIRLWSQFIEATVSADTLLPWKTCCLLVRIPLRWPQASTIPLVSYT